MPAAERAGSLARKRNVMADNVQELIVELKSIKDNPVEYMRPVVLVLAGFVRHRIHIEGLRADGSPIGQYKNSYLKQRQTKYNRDSSEKIIYSLTRQMEQDFVPIAENDAYGLGFNNQHNFDKATWLEEKRPGVYSLSATEEDIAEQTIIDYLNGLFG